MFCGFLVKILLLLLLKKEKFLSNFKCILLLKWGVNWKNKRMGWWVIGMF